MKYYDNYMTEITFLIRSYSQFKSAIQTVCTNITIKPQLYSSVSKCQQLQKIASSNK